MDKETRDMLITLTREVSRLSTLVESDIGDRDDKEKRIRKLEKYMYGLPAAYVLTIVSVVTSAAKTVGK